MPWSPTPPRRRKPSAPSKSSAGTTFSLPTTPTALICCSSARGEGGCQLGREHLYRHAAHGAGALSGAAQLQKLDTINKHLRSRPFNHHRAVDDAMALARIYEVMLTDLEEKRTSIRWSLSTPASAANKEVLKKKYYHLIILVQNQVGLKNLYRIVSAAHTQYFFKKRACRAACLNQYREGLLLPRPVKQVSFLQGNRGRSASTNSCSALPIITIISRCSRSATMNSWCATGRWTRSRPSKTSTAPS